jgi:hypothetical protein
MIGGMKLSHLAQALLFTPLVLFSLAPASIGADAGAPKEFLKFTTEKVIVFKDGHALVIKKGKGKADANGEIHTLEVPDAAVLGSFWATTPGDGELLGMRAGWREEEATDEVTESALDNLAILRANEGAKCVVVTEEGETLKGVIQKVLVKENQVATAAPNTGRVPVDQWRSSRLAILQDVPSGAGTVVPISSTTTSISGTHFVLRTVDGDILLPAAGVRSLKIPEMKTETSKSVTRKTRSKQLTFRFAKGGGEHIISMMYFRPGVRWIPTYRINLPEGEGKMAEVSLQAEILNEAEDLIDVPIDIVVGVPNFRFKKTPSPLALESVMRNTLAQAEPTLMGQMGNQFSNASYASRHSERSGGAANAGGDGLGDLDLSGELSGAGAQDLFVYNLPNLRLRKGDRAAVAIFTAKVPYRDVYTWDLHLQREDIATAPSSTGIDSPMKLTKNSVWHQIELTNATKMPWTTGAAIIMQGQQPLAQELLTYTSPGDLCRVPVTVSVETRGSFSEQETGRKLDDLVWDRTKYAKIDNRALLHLCNNKPAPIDVEISVTFGGRASEVSDDGKITLKPFDSTDWSNYRGSSAVNNRSVVNWKVKLKPGGIFEPTIDYSFYTRH